MPSSETSPQPRVERYPTPGSFLRSCLWYDTWHMNIALGTTLQYVVEKGVAEPERGTPRLWLAVWTGDELDVTLVRTSPMITLCSPKHSDSLSASWLEPRMQLLAEEINELVTSGSQPSIKSSTGATVFVDAFAAAYAKVSGIRPSDGPLVLDTFHTHCPRSRVSFKQPELPEGHAIRLVLPGDPKTLRQLGELLLRFRNDHPGPGEKISLDQAIQAAEVGVRHSEVLVYVISSAEGGEEEYAGYVRDGRLTGRTGAVRNVYTMPNWRRRGIAEALTRAAVVRLLSEPHRLSEVVKRYLPEGKEPKLEEVCIFAEKGNLSAQGVYARVGYGFPLGEWEEEDGKSWEACVEVAYPGYGEDAW